MVFCLVVVFIAPFSFSQYPGAMNMIDENGKRQGSWIITAGMLQLGPPWTPDQIVCKGNYINSFPVGDWTRFDDNGNVIAISQYDTLMHHALCTTYKGGMAIAERNYIEGRHEGIEKTFYDDGTLWSEFTWKNGRLDGPAKTYYPNGKICEDGYWKHNYWDMNQAYTLHKK